MKYVYLYHWCDDFGRKLQSNIKFNILKEVWNYILWINLIKWIVHEKKKKILNESIIQLVTYSCDKRNLNFIILMIILAW